MQLPTAFRLLSHSVLTYINRWANKKKTCNVDFYFSGEDPDFALFKPPSDFPLNLIGKLMNFCLI